MMFANMVVGWFLDFLHVLWRTALGFVAGLIINLFLRPFGVDMAQLGALVAFVSYFFQPHEPDEDF